MILSIPILNKLKILAQVSGPLSASPLNSPIATGGRRGLVIAVETADDTAMKQLTRALANSMKEHDVHILPTPQLPHNVEPSFRSYLRLVDEYHSLSIQIKKLAMGSTKSNHRRVRDVDGDEEMEDEGLHARHRSDGDDKHDEAESEVSPKTLPKEASHRGAAFYPNTPTAHHHAPLATSSSPMTPHPSYPLSHDYPPQPDSQEHRRPYSPSPSPSPPSSPTKRPIVLLPSYTLTHTDAFASTVDIADRYSPVDHWRWGATIWRGVVGADVTVAVRAPIPLSGSTASLAGGSSGSGENSPTPTSTTQSSASGGNNSSTPATASGPGVQGTTGSRNASVAAGGGGCAAPPPPPPLTATSTSTSTNTVRNHENHQSSNASASAPASAPTTTTSGSASNTVEIRLDEARAVIVRGEPEGGVAESALRRVGFEVGEWVMGWFERGGGTGG